MRCPPFVLGALSAVTVALAGPVAAGVTVYFVDPGRYTDAGDFERDSRRTLVEIARYLRLLGDRYLSAQETLSIEVLDITLAGRPRLFLNSNWEVRTMTGEADWPRIELRYRLASSGRSAKPAEETITDMSYLRRLEPKYASLSLPYEERMLDEWFRARFAERLSAP